MKQNQCCKYLRNCMQAIAVTLLLSAVSTTATAQNSYAKDSSEEEDRPSSDVSGRAAATAERARRKRAQRQQQEQPQTNAQPAQYPLALRVEPKLKATAKGTKALREILADSQAKNYPAVIIKVDALATQSFANAYDKSFAYQLAADAEIQGNNPTKAVEYYRLAVEANGLDNNDHFRTMYNQAIVQDQLRRHADALKTVDLFLSETRSEKAEAITFKAGLLSKLNRPAEAVSLYEKILVQKPNDKLLLFNAVALYQQAGNTARANALLEQIRKQNLLTAEDGQAYRILYVGQINAGKLKDAIALMDEGIAKGAIRANQTLANDYAKIAEHAYLDQNNATLAIEMFRRAAKISSNGEASLNLAKVLQNEGRAAEAKLAAQDALTKGVERPAEANRIIAAAKK